MPDNRLITMNDLTVFTTGLKTILDTSYSGGGSVDLTNVESNIVPSTDIKYNLGSQERMFNTLYINSLKGSKDNWWYGSGIMLDSTLLPSNNVEGWGKVKECDLGDPAHYFNNAFFSNVFLNALTTEQTDGHIICECNLLPGKDYYDNIVYDLGTNQREWRNIYGTNIYQGNNKVIDSSSVGVGSTAIQNMLDEVFA